MCMEALKIAGLDYIYIWFLFIGMYYKKLLKTVT